MKFVEVILEETNVCTYIFNVKNKETIRLLIVAFVFVKIKFDFQHILVKTLLNCFKMFLILTTFKK